MDLPEEGIQIAPVYLERFQSLQAEFAAIEDYLKAAGEIYIKNSKRLKEQDKNLWAEVLLEYGVLETCVLEITPDGILRRKLIAPPAPIE